MGSVVLAGAARPTFPGAVTDRAGNALENLLEPFSVEDFLAEHWGRTALHIPGAPDKFRPLGFDAQTLEEILAGPAREDRMRLRFVGPDDKVRARPAALTRRSLSDGDLTMCVDWINDRVESLATFCSEVKSALSHPGTVFMTCYASAPGHGFGVHWDCQASFILQVEGSKTWRYSAAPGVAWPPVVVSNARVVPEVADRYPWMRVEFPGEAAQAAFVERVLTLGDVLFLPAGTWHRAQAEEYSVALTMACVPMSAADFVDDVVRGRLAASADWRQSVPPVPTLATPHDRLPPAVHAFFEERLAELRAQVAELSANDLYETWTHHVAALDTPFEAAPPSASPRVSFGEVLSIPDGLSVRYVVRPGEDTVSVYRPGARVDLREAALPIVTGILRHGSFRAVAARDWLGGGASWGDVQPVLAELVRVGVLVVDRPS